MDSKEIFKEWANNALDGMKEYIETIRDKLNMGKQDEQMIAAVYVTTIDDFFGKQLNKIVRDSCEKIESKLSNIEEI